MSKWTHVAGVVRYDDLLRNPIEAYKEIKRIEELYKNTPQGSEGGLVYSIENRHRYEQNENVTSYGAHLCDVSFSGDLRDFGEDDWPQLYEFFKTITESEGLYVRQAVMVLNDDGYPESRNKVILYEENGE